LPVGVVGAAIASAPQVGNVLGSPPTSLKGLLVVIGAGIGNGVV
jgi:hypothetical protein